MIVMEDWTSAYHIMLNMRKQCNLTTGKTAQNISVLTMFGDELCVTPERDMQNPRENVNELHHSNDSHHRCETIIQSVFNDSYH
jgi:hypothetical protein